MTCNYCGSEESEIITEYTRFEKNNILKCKNCGLVYLEMNSGKKTVESFYSSEYRKVSTLPLMSPEEHFSNDVTRNDTENRIRFISGCLDLNDKKVLEIGSASGNLLQKLKESGCKEAVGVELGKEYAEYARRKGFKVFTNSLEELGLKAEFDAVATFHTLEHVYDPMAVFKGIYTALKPGGIFLGEVPNQNDWRIQIFDDETIKRFHYDPNHYYYFSPATFENYLKACGFSNIRLETVERYNSLLQLRNILCRDGSEKNIEAKLKKHIFPKNKEDDVRLPDMDDGIAMVFNRLFERGVNTELMGNCLRWIAKRA
jgi:2-polyprenyl-3-methyl-5-hydroxy-6-metoxy-1,4-benzoquinol methylase